jgi:hypothetical protein
MDFTLSSQENVAAIVSKLDEQVVARSWDDIFFVF